MPEGLRKIELSVAPSYTLMRLADVIETFGFSLSAVSLSIQKQDDGFLVTVTEIDEGV